MTDTTHASTGASIADKTDRLEEIIAQLEGGDLSLARAKELHTEGSQLLEELETELEIGDGEIIEHE